MSDESEQFAENYAKECERWRAYQRNRAENCEYEGDWNELLAELNGVLK